MKNLYYFQRYSQRENWATNNTLLLLSRLYQFNRLKFQRALTDILGEGIELSIGIQFTQQNKNKDSTPDGIIEQSSFKIVIETKLADDFTADQLIRHLSAFESNSDVQILLAITKHEATKDVTEAVNSYLKSTSSKIKFASTSFLEVANAVRHNLQEHDVEMIEIVDEYLVFCEDNNLINRRNSTLLALTAGVSLDMNLVYNIYYDPASRNHNLPFKYIGLYKEKSIVAVGEVSKIVECDIVRGELVIKDNSQLSQQEKERIKSIVQKTNYYDLTKDTKFFLVDQFFETYYEKTSDSSLRGKRYFFLHEIDGYRPDMNASEIAGLLKSKSWK